MYFTEALLNMGWDVIGLCPDPEDANRMLQERLGAHDPRNWEKRVTLQPICKTRCRISNRAGTLWAPLSRADCTARRFLSMEGKLRGIAKSSGKRIQGIVYACIYDLDFRDIRWIDRLLSLPWVGLYVHANSIRIPPPVHVHPQNHPLPERLFSGRRCRGVGLLDEGIVGQVSLRSAKPAIAFPDITDARLDESPGGSVLATQLKEFAHGRRIIGLFGHLVRSKGILQLLETAQLPEMQGLCFAFAGELGNFGYSATELESIHQAFANCPNVWAHPERIPNEPVLNSLIDTCDVIAACYTDFPHSSNILTKAACLRKPVIVNDGYLMAERVRQFSLGEVIPQGDTTALCQAILRLTGTTANGVEQSQYGWDAFTDVHSFERFENAVRSLIGHMTKS